MGCLSNTMTENIDDAEHSIDNDGERKMQTWGGHLSPPTTGNTKILSRGRGSLEHVYNDGERENVPAWIISLSPCKQRRKMDKK